MIYTWFLLHVIYHLYASKRTWVSLSSTIENTDPGRIISTIGSFYRLFILLFSVGNYLNVIQQTFHGFNIHQLTDKVNLPDHVFDRWNQDLPPRYLPLNDIHIIASRHHDIDDLPYILAIYRYH